MCVSLESIGVLLAAFSLTLQMTTVSFGQINSDTIEKQQYWPNTDTDTRISTALTAM